MHHPILRVTRARVFLLLVLLAGTALVVAGKPSVAAPPATAPVRPALQEACTSLLSAYRVVVKDGKETLVEAASAKPGEVIEYQVRYFNRSTGPVKNLQPTLPIPAATTFLGDSALPGAATATTDGTSFAALPLHRQVKAADGSLKDELVPLSEYRALRWNLGTLDAGKTATVSARVRVKATAPATRGVKP